MGRRATVLSLLAVALLTAAQAGARVVKVTVERREAVLGGRSFGAAGPYEKLSGTVEFALDPGLRQNQAVVDLTLAPRNERGEVTFTADVFIVKPADLRRGNGRVYFEVPNRGGKAILRRLQRAESSLDPSTTADFGDGWLMRQGFALVWMGWQWDVPERPGLLRLLAPTATQKGAISGLVRSVIIVDKKEGTAPLGDRSHLAYPAVDPEGPDSRLFVRDHRLDPPRLVPRQSWRFADPATVALDGGFGPGRIYEVVYRSRDPRVVGCGLAATRDLVSFFKNEQGDGNPLAGVRHALGHGVSQSGRFLRHFIYQGFNEDEHGGRVFDGVFAEVAGGGRGSFNHRFAQASRDGYQHWNVLYPTDLFPFTDLPETDPETDTKGGLLDRARATNTVPRLFHVMTSYEYWNRAGSLVHTDPTGTRDAPIPESSRIYLIASAQHGPGGLPPSTGGTSSAHGPNPNDFRPALRALVQALDAWVVDGVEPPPSLYPRIADGTLVPPERAGWPALPGVRFPLVRNEPVRLDHGPEWPRGIITIEPPRLGGVFPALVPAVDADGNERAGVRLPDVAVPLATQTGWNWRHPDTGAPDSLVGVVGSYLPFAGTAAERRATGDPRPSIEERYRGRDDYLGKVASVALDLARRRLLLAEDVPFLLERAAAHWDGRTASGPGVNATALAGIVGAERAFATDSVKRGVRASFLAAFAEDGINFTPHPERTREALLKQQQPRASADLDWHPVWADVSAAGDLGYTTGPYVRRSRGPQPRVTRRGYYFSIWRRQEDGSWKVAVDAGIQTPEPNGEACEPWYRPAPEAGRGPGTAPLSSREAEAAIRAREAELAEAFGRTGAVALADFATPEVRLHRDRHCPHLGLVALRAAVVGEPAPASIEVMGAGAAASGDLGYAWGKSTFPDGGTGYFVRVWRRGPDGRFRVTLDWANAVPGATGA